MLEPIPELLRDWESEDPLRAARAKLAMCLMPFEEANEVTPFFGVVFQELLENLRGFFEVVVKRKASFPKDDVPPSLTQLIPEAPGHYATILGFVDDAIKKRAALLQSSAVEEKDRPTAAPTTPLCKQSLINFPRTPLNTHLTNVPELGFHTLRKRTSDLVDLEDETPSRSKKQKQHPHAPFRSSSLSLGDENSD
jgi:hypothetical protein